MRGVREYVVKLRHDGGVVHIHTWARNAKVAGDLVLAAERNAPRRAVISVRRRRAA